MANFFNVQKWRMSKISQIKELQKKKKNVILKIKIDQSINLYIHLIRKFSNMKIG